VLSILEHAERPMTPKEINLLLIDSKNSRSVSREISSLMKRDMLIRVEIKIPDCQKIVLYQLKKGYV